MTPVTQITIPEQAGPLADGRQVGRWRGLNTSQFKDDTIDSEKPIFYILARKVYPECSTQPTAISDVIDAAVW